MSRVVVLLSRTYTIEVGFSRRKSDIFQIAATLQIGPPKRIAGLSIATVEIALSLRPQGASSAQSQGDHVAESTPATNSGQANDS